MACQGLDSPHLICKQLRVIDKTNQANRLHQMICYNLYSGWRFIQAFYRSALPTGMNPQRFYVLSLCEREDGINVSEIAAVIQIELPAVSALLGRMERSDLIERRPSPHNRREVLVFLTPEGERMRGETYARMNTIRGKLTRYVTEEDVVNLRDLVGRIKELSQS